jgi:hypothetical protein
MAAEPMQAEIRARVEAAEIHGDPFPHVVVEDLLPEAFFRELAATIPPIEYFKQAKNGRKADLPIIATNKTYLETPEDFRATWGRLRDDVLHDTVAPVLAERLRGDVRDKFADLFSPEIADEVMGSDLVSSAGRIMLRKPGYKLGPHTDSAMYAITCLLYFTEADEESSGALCLFRPERRPELKHVSTYYPDEEEGIEAEVAKVIPIRENLFVAFVNGQESLHGVRVDADQPSNEFRMTYQAHLVLEHDPRKQVPSYLEDDRLADPAARERWARYVAERREAEAAAER